MPPSWTTFGMPLQGPIATQFSFSFNRMTAVASTGVDRVLGHDGC